MKNMTERFMAMNEHQRPANHGMFGTDYTARIEYLDEQVRAAKQRMDEERRKERNNHDYIH